ncbi:MAG: M20 family metallopeptidase [Gudongella sp.]|nr:M20 family metallopeptidase [Gudongella sp.]
MINSDNILDRAKELQDELIQNRRHLHKNPELFMELPNTVAFVQQKLKEMGIESTKLGGGVVANIGDSTKGKTILLRADMDALPIKEETGLEFASINNAMHACGHDVHTSSLLGAAKILKENEDSINGNVKLMFQPGEEVLAGAKAMIDEGILENPKVDAAMMIHVFSGFDVEPGKLLLPKVGAASMAPDEFHIYIQGKGGHGAMPHTAIDPLNIAAHTHISLQELISRETNPGEKAICIVGHMSGGEAGNVMADTAKMVGSIRTVNPKTREFLKNRIIEISEGVAKTFRGSARVEYTVQCPSVINDVKMREFGNTFGIELFGDSNVEPLDSYMDGGMLSGSEDFSFISELVPSFMSIISMGSTNDGYEFSHHHPKTDFDEREFYKSAAYYAYYALKYLESEVGN